MTIRLNPYINFDGTARAAVEFYETVFGGTLTVMTFGEGGGMEGPGADKVMHAMLDAPGGLTLMAADVPPGMEHQPGNNISISLSGEDVDQLRTYWAKLSDGGTVTVPLEIQMWGDEFGSCIDRFGITWMVNITQAPA